MKRKLFGAGLQSNGLVAPTVLLTLRISSSYSVPDPFRGAKSFAKADTRRVFIVAVVVRTFPVTFQLPLVSPAF